MARSRQRQTSRRTNGRGQGRTRPLDNEGIIPVLARAVREIESAVQRGQAVSVRARFQVVALLVREERARVRADTELTEAKRDGSSSGSTGSPRSWPRPPPATPSLFSLLAEDADVSDQASDMRREMLERAGVEVEEDEPVEPAELPAVTERRVVPQSVLSRQLANPFLVPDFTAASQNRGAGPPAGRLGAARPAVPLVRGRRQRRLDVACRCPSRAT